MPFRLGAELADVPGGKDRPAHQWLPLGRPPHGSTHSPGLSAQTTLPHTLHPALPRRSCNAIQEGVGTVSLSMTQLAASQDGSSGLILVLLPKSLYFEGSNKIAERCQLLRQLQALLLCFAFPISTSVTSLVSNTIIGKQRLNDVQLTHTEDFFKDYWKNWSNVKYFLWRKSVLFLQHPAHLVVWVPGIWTRRYWTGSKFGFSMSKHHTQGSSGCGPIQLHLERNHDHDVHL